MTQTASVPQEPGGTKARISTTTIRSIPLFLLHVPTNAARLQSSRSPYVYASYTYLHCLQTSRALEANTSTSARLRRTSRAPDVHLSTGVLPLRCMEIGSSGGMLRAWRRGSVEVWRCAAGLGTWKCRGMEISSSGGMLQA